MKNQPQRKINIFNKITLLALIVLLQIGVIVYGYKYVQDKIVVNKNLITAYSDTVLQISGIDTTITKVKSYIVKIGLLENNYPKPDSFESLVKEVEALSSKLGILDTDITLEDGLNVNLNENQIKSHIDKTYTNKTEGLDSLDFYITIKSDYTTALNFISWLEKSKYINNIKDIRMEKRDMQTSEQGEQAVSDFQYIETTIQSTFYFKLDKK